MKCTCCLHYTIPTAAKALENLKGDHNAFRKILIGLWMLFQKKSGTEILRHCRILYFRFLFKVRFWKWMVFQLWEEWDIWKTYSIQGSVSSEWDILCIQSEIDDIFNKQKIDSIFIVSNTINWKIELTILMFEKEIS